MTGVFTLAAGWFGRSIAWSAPRGSGGEGARARARRAAIERPPSSPSEDDRPTQPAARLIATIEGEPTADVLTRVASGDANALAALYRTFYEPLWRFAIVLLRSPETAEEVIQDVFLRLAAKRATLKETTDIRVYLYTAVRNRVRDLARHQRTTTTVETLVQDEALDAPAIGAGPAAPDALAEGAEFMRAYRDALSVVSARERQALQLRWDEELTLSQIATALGVSIEGARLTIARARQKIQAALERYRG